MIDDDEDTRDLLAVILGMQGATVLTAPTAEAGLEIVRTERPSVLVSDISLPDLDGHELLRKAKSVGGSIPAIAMTGHATEEDRARSLAAGYQLHITKPFEPAEIARKIASVVGGES